MCSIMDRCQVYVHDIGTFELITIDEIKRVFRQGNVFFRLLILVKRYFPDEYSFLLTIGQEELENVQIISTYLLVLSLHKI